MRLGRTAGAFCINLLLISGCRTTDGPATHGSSRPLPAAANDETPSALRVELPAFATDPTLLHDPASGIAVTFKVMGAAARRGESSDGAVVYRNAVAGADLVQRVTTRGVEDFVHFAAKPAEESLAYDVDVSRVQGIRFVANVIELLDASGTPRLRVNPPCVIDAFGQRVTAQLEVNDCAFDSAPAAPWGHPITPPGRSHCTLRVRWQDVSYPALLDPAWTATGTLITARYSHSAVLLNTGKILVAGGGTQTTELYDPATSTFAAGPTMNAAAGARVALSLGSGKVLLALGGTIGQIYDPTTGLLTNTPALANRDEVAGVVLADGRVLLAGPNNAEIYTPTANAFVPLAPRALGDNASGLSLTQLTDGKVLALRDSSSDGSIVEIFDPVSSFFAAVGTHSTGYGHSAVRLPDGRVLVTGGHIAISSVSDAALYDPATKMLTAVSPGMLSAREEHVGILLDSGKVLLVGGGSGTGFPAIATTELYDPITGLFTPNAVMTIARISHTATLLANANVVVIGGKDAKTTPLATAEQARFAGVGDACATSIECLSASCVDGVCCPSACDGPCEACDVAGSIGSCTVVTGAPHGKHSCGDPGTCAGTCDGTSATSCRYPPGNATCDTFCSGNNETLKTCDGLGHCQAQAPRTCDGNLTCGDASCKTACVTTADCITGFECADDGTCRSGATCSDEHTSVSATGVATDCSPYRCDVAGVCKSTCASVSDCEAPSICGADRHCTTLDAGDDSGCSASAARHPTLPMLPCIATVTALAFVLRRRKAHAGRRDARS